MHNVFFFLSLESIHQCVLSDFKSKFSDDPNGIVMIAVSLLREITGIITASNKKLDSLSFEDANSIKTIISSVVQLVAHCASEDQKRVADEVATKFELQETLLQLLCNHDCESNVHETSGIFFSIPISRTMPSLTFEVIKQWVQYTI